MSTTIIRIPPKTTPELTPEIKPEIPKADAELGKEAIPAVETAAGREEDEQKEAAKEATKV